MFVLDRNYSRREALAIVGGLAVMAGTLSACDIGGEKDGDDERRGKQGQAPGAAGQPTPQSSKAAPTTPSK